MTIFRGSGVQSPEGLAGAGGDRIIWTRAQEKDCGSQKESGWVEVGKVGAKNPGILDREQIQGLGSMWQEVK